MKSFELTSELSPQRFTVVSLLVLLLSGFHIFLPLEYLIPVKLLPSSSSCSLPLVNIQWKDLQALVSWPWAGWHSDGGRRITFALLTRFKKILRRISPTFLMQQITDHSVVHKQSVSSKSHFYSSIYFAVLKHFYSFDARGTFQKACLATNGWQQPTRVQGFQSLRVHDLRGS